VGGWGPTVLHTLLSFSVVASLSTVQTSPFRPRSSHPSPDSLYDLVQRFLAGHALPGGGGGGGERKNFSLGPEPAFGGPLWGPGFGPKAAHLGFIAGQIGK